MSRWVFWGSVYGGVYRNSRGGVLEVFGFLYLFFSRLFSIVWLQGGVGASFGFVRMLFALHCKRTEGGVIQAWARAGMNKMDRWMGWMVLFASNGRVGASEIL